MGICLVVQSACHISLGYLTFLKCEQTNWGAVCKATCMYHTYLCGFLLGSLIIVIEYPVRYMKINL